MALVFVSASRSRWIAKSGGQGGDLAIPAEQVAQTKIMAHVITWIGQVNGTGDYLVIDSHDELNARDSNDQTAPTGVQIRPFREDRWYYTAFSHANRILTGDRRIFLPLVTRAYAP